MSAERYELLPADRAADDLERELLERWESEDLFRQTLEKNANGKPWVFFEGPPTANGKPGIHHVFARTIKDLFCRHRAMRGYRVDRKAGWDTHGLPVEIEVEKQLGISGKQQIEKLGVAEFNRLCRESVFKYRSDWEKLSARIGYWLDYEHPYVTYTNDYVESVWWALKTLHDKDLLYRGHKILPYCARCGTALSSHELAQGYKDVEGPSVYVALPVVEGGGRRAEGGGQAEGGGRQFLVWTTTPWTLVSNVALAVHPDIDYVEVRKRKGTETRTLILAEARLKPVLGDDFDDRWEVVARIKGSMLVGMRYQRPFEWLEYPPEGEHETIVGEDFVSASDGSGIVHMAPAFGADDYAAGRRHNLAFLQPVDARGEFPTSLPVAGGKFVLDADPLLTEELKRRGLLFRAAKHMHSYPHCWRCGTPLIYYARTSWFVKTSSYKDAMLARNARIDWHPPEVGQGRFGEWLENNIDWAISRDRYWGTPLPVWICDAEETHVDVIGSYADLADRTGKKLSADFDPHKPQIDSHAWKCSRDGCAGTMRRTPEVIDTWFDSGSMSFAQWHYPFENRERFADQFPADFIAEGVDQTRGWFYSLLAIATGLGDALEATERNGQPAAPPYKAVVVNDLLLDAKGEKMSKSKGNVVDPHEMIAKYGVDAMRLFFIAASDVSVARRFDEKVIRELAGRFLLTLKNVYSGSFAQYANFGWKQRDPAPGSLQPIDRWLLGRLAKVEQEADAALERFDATTAARLIMTFVDEDLSKWYVRLTRDRRYEVDSDDANAAFLTLSEALLVVCRLLAPFTPFLSDWMHRQLTGGSVHLAPYAEGRHTIDHGLDRAMDAIRELSRLGRAAREVAGINVRQPLPRLVCVAPSVTARDFDALIPLLREELNVKQVEVATSGDALVTLEAKPNFRSLGKRFGKKTPLAAAAVQAFTSADLLRFEHGEELIVSVDGESHALVAEDVSIIRRASGDLVVQESGGFFAALDKTITPELRREGLARELISRVQRMRKESGFAISDRIRLVIAGDRDILEAVKTHEEWIKGDVLATELVIADTAAPEQPGMTPIDLDGIAVRVSITRTP